MMDMRLQIEGVIFHPVGIVQPQRHLQELTSKHRGFVELAFEGAQNILETDSPALFAGRLIKKKKGDVHGRTFRLLGEKHRIGRA